MGKMLIYGQRFHLNGFYKAFTQHSQVFRDLINRILTKWHVSAQVDSVYGTT